MTEETLNRLGIFLNVVSGFVLTPAIIGEKRIAALRQRALDAGEKLRVSSDNLMAAYESREHKPPKWLSRLATVVTGSDSVLVQIWLDVAALFMPILYRLTLTLLPLAAVIYIGMATLLIAVTNVWLRVPLFIAVMGGLVGAVLLLWLIGIMTALIGMRAESPFLWWAAGMAVLSGTCIFLRRYWRDSTKYVTAMLSIDATALILRPLGTPDSTQALVAWFGISLFIVGNALQFAAIYVKRH